MGTEASEPGRRCWALPVLLLLTAACQGDGPATTLGEVSLGAERDRPLVTLSSRERAQACDSTRDWLAIYERDEREPSCRVVATFFASLGTTLVQELSQVQNDCTSLYNECVEGRFAGMQPMRPLNLLCEPLPRTCAATVGMVEDCFRETAEHLARVRTFPRCADLTEEDVNRSLEQLVGSVLMPSCLEAAARCSERDGRRDGPPQDEGKEQDRNVAPPRRPPTRARPTQRRATPPRTTASRSRAGRLSGSRSANCGDVPASRRAGRRTRRTTSRTNSAL